MKQYLPGDQGPATAALSSAQRRLWFLERLQPNSGAYNIPQSYRLSGRLDVDALQQSLATVVARHESLRTSFIDRNGEPLQIIAAAVEVDLPVVDLSMFDGAEQTLRLRKMVAADFQEPFDLAQAPLFRFQLYRLGDAEHVFALTLHHLIADGWSMQILHREVGIAYRAFRNGGVPDLPAVARQYRDYVAWQALRLNDPVTQADLDYWCDRLAGVVPLDLATDRPRPAVRSHRGMLYEFPVSEAVFTGMEGLCRGLRTTPFIIWLTALQVFLHRYTGQNDITVGTPIAGRNLWEFESTIGLFIDTLVLRGDLSGNLPFVDLLAKTRTAALDAYAHQSVSFETLVEVINPERVLNRSPFFDVLLNVRTEDAHIGLDGVDVSPVQLGRGGAKFDLTFSVKPNNSSIAIEYSSDLFDQGTVERMGSHFMCLVGDILADENRRIGEMALMNDAQRHTLLSHGDATPRFEVEGGSCVHHCFRRCAARFSESPAAVCGDTSLTYAELDARSSQVANFLLRHGNQAARIGIHMDQCLELPVAVLGVLKAGAAYVPLDANMPRERLAHIVAEADIRLVLTAGHIKEGLSDLNVELRALDSGWEEFAGLAPDDPGIPVDPSSVMYVLYTSGSTGRPKGVEVEHAQVLNYVDGITHRCQFTQAWSYALVQPLAVDSSVTMLFGSLLNGGTLHLMSRETVLDPAAVAAYFATRPIDVLKIAPSHLAALRCDGRHPIMPRQCLILGGEPCPREWTYALAQAHPNVAIYNHYGPTETTVGVLTFRVPGRVGSGASIPIGEPLPNTQIYVLDAYSNPVPMGVSGELCIQGPSVARGYLGQPELTKAAFVQNPLKEGRGQRMYRTGDRVRYRPDGMIEFLGRIDDQIKVRGYRVEPEEIAAVMVEHGAVRDTAVIQVTRHDAAPALVAFIVASDTDVDHADLRNHLLRRLPDYMVPTEFLSLDELPRTLLGKVDRQALRAMARASKARNRGVAPAPPRTETERRLVGIWSAELGIDTVGVTDSFFALGGHSLLGVKVIARISQEWGVQVPVRALFDHPNIAAVAARIDDLVGAGPGAPAPPAIKRLPRSLTKNTPT